MVMVVAALEVDEAFVTVVAGPLEVMAVAMAMMALLVLVVVMVMPVAVLVLLRRGRAG